MISNDASPTGCRRSWCRAWPGWILAALFLAVGLPVFVRMPPWCDLTLYELAARTVITGGVHYRDVFDTNLPGFVWALVLVRRAFGPSVEAVRLVDLAIVFACCWLLARLARRAGADRPALAWFAAGTSAFYPFTTEFCHAQRDVWMLLPALVALTLRLGAAPRRPFARGLLEGLLWGAAVWIKPHCLFPAVGVWLATGRRDTLPNLLGGSLAGAIGIAWLVRTGTWPYFVDVFTRWNPHYTEYLFVEIGWRAVSHWFHFAPWTYLQPFVAALALADLCRGSRWVSKLPRRFYVPASTETNGRYRAALGAFYLAWLLQSFLLQRQFPYVHVPGTLIGFALFAAHRWAVVPAGLLFLAASSGVAWACDRNDSWRERIDRVERSFPWIRFAVPRHAISVPEQWLLWPECWRTLNAEAARRRQDRLGNYPDSFSSIAVAEAYETAAWLRGHGATAADVIAWHSSPHAVFLDLPGTPAFRFLHADTPLIRPATYEYMRTELLAAVPRAKYVVCDLCRTFSDAPPDRKGDWYSESIELPPGANDRFPYNQPIVFRSDGGRGRYVVRELTQPVDRVEYDPPRDTIWKTE